MTFSKLLFYPTPSHPLIVAMGPSAPINPITMDSADQDDKDVEKAIKVDVAPEALPLPPSPQPQPQPDAPPESESHRSTPPEAPSNTEIAIDDVRQISSQNILAAHHQRVAANWRSIDRNGIIQTTTRMRECPTGCFGVRCRV